MNIDSDIPNEISTSQSQSYIRRIICHDEVEFALGIPALFNILKSISLTDIGYSYYLLLNKHWQFVSFKEFVLFFFVFTFIYHKVLIMLPFILLLSAEVLLMSLLIANICNLCSFFFLISVGRNLSVLFTSFVSFVVLILLVFYFLVVPLGFMVCIFNLRQSIF